MSAVVYVASRDPMGPGGGGTVYLRAHARAARQAGFESHVFCAAPRSATHETPYGRVHLVRSSALPLVAPRGVEFRKAFISWHAPLLAASVRRFLVGREGPHLVHGFSTWSCVGPMVARSLRRHGTQVATVSTYYTTARHESDGKLQGMAAHSLLRRLMYRADNLVIRNVVDRFERLGYLGADLVIVNYEIVRQLLERSYGPRSGVRWLPYCSESAFFQDDGGAGVGPPILGAAPGGASSPLVVSVSRHDARKGIDLLLRALAALRDAGVPFRACLLSGGELLGAHRALAARLGLGDRVSLPGWVDDPYSYLRLADVFVLPSFEEGSGAVALLEALQAGAAVVASAIDGVVEDVTDGETALLAPPGDQAALAAALRRLLLDPALRRRLAERGQTLFRLRFSAEGLVKALADTYAELGLRPAPLSPGSAPRSGGAARSDPR